MKKQLMATAAKVIKRAAVISAESTSLIFAYQPKTPDILKTPDNKKA